MTTRLLDGTVRVTTTLVLTTCCSCGVLFGLEESFENQRYGDGKSWYCPNGHSQVFTKSTAARLSEAELEIEKLKASRQRISDDLLDEVKKRTAAERERQRIEKRIHAGVCPLCRRNFANVRAHMDRKHSDKCV